MLSMCLSPTFDHFNILQYFFYRTCVCVCVCVFHADADKQYLIIISLSNYYY